MNETLIRAGCFLAVFALMALWEVASPRRHFDAPRRRWPANLGLLVLDALVLRLLFPSAALGVALLARTHGFGLLPALDLPGWFALPAGVLLLDLVVYLQHVMFHAVPLLWRVHRVHHADPAFDLSTGVRFHPLEIALSMLLKMAAVAAIGPPLAAVLAFEVLLNACSLFNHGNVRLAPDADRVLRWLLVTPDMHRVHHSCVRRETDSNFGFCLSYWDRLFGTYRVAPAAGQEDMVFGLPEAPPTRGADLLWALAWPFTGATRGRGATRVEGG